MSENYRELSAGETLQRGDQIWWCGKWQEILCTFDNHASLHPTVTKGMRYRRKTEPEKPREPEAEKPAIICKPCGFSGTIDAYLPSFSMHSDCQCPQCGSTNNEHNTEYRERINKAWNCKHVGTLVDGGVAQSGSPLLECTECGSVGLDWHMRGEPRPTEPEAETKTPISDAAMDVPENFVGNILVVPHEVADGLEKTLRDTELALLTAQGWNERDGGPAGLAKLLENQNFRYCICFLKNAGEWMRATRLVMDIAPMSAKEAKQWVLELKMPMLCSDALLAEHRRQMEQIDQEEGGVA